MKSHSGQNNNSLVNAVIYWVSLQKVVIKCKLSDTISRPLCMWCPPIQPISKFFQGRSQILWHEVPGCSAKIKISVLKNIYNAETAGESSMQFLALMVQEVYVRITNVR